MATSNYQTSGQTCPQCLGAIRDERTERVCGRCGLVVDDAPIDHGPEYRHFRDSDSDPRHYSQKDPNRSDKGLGSRRGWQLGDAQDSRLRTWEQRLRGSSRGRSRDYATTEIHRVGVAVGLTRPIIERAQYLFRVVHADGDCHSTDLDTLAVACLHIACRENAAGRTMDELTEYARTDSRSALRRVHWVADVADVAVEPPDVRARIRVLGGRLALTEQAVRRAIEFYEGLEGPEHTSGAANTLAGLCIWKATEQTQRRVAHAAGCSAGGIRKRKRLVE